MQSLLVLLGLSATTLATPFAAALENQLFPRQSCSTPDGDGSCGSTSSCGGFSVPGYCPGSSDIQCCVSVSCGSGGTCMDTSSSCSGTFASGLCPGPSNVQCCEASSGGGGGGSGSGAGIVSAAQSQIGVPYVYGGGGCGGESDGGFDCSGLTQYSVCQGVGITIPRTAQTQYDATSQGSPVSTSSLEPGDLVFWANYGDCSSSVEHTAVYIGNNQIVAAPETGQDVQTQTLWTSSGALELCPNGMRFW